MRFQVDSSASVDAIPKSYVRNKLEEVPSHLITYNGTIIVPNEKCWLNLKNETTQKIYSVKIVKVDMHFAPLLRRETSNMGLNGELHVDVCTWTEPSIIEEHYWRYISARTHVTPDGT